MVKNPYSNDTLNFIPDPDEISLLVTNHAHDFWWQSAGMKVARNAIASMFVLISYENKEFST